MYWPAGICAATLYVCGQPYDKRRYTLSRDCDTSECEKKHFHLHNENVFNSRESLMKSGARWLENQRRGFGINRFVESVACNSWKYGREIAHMAASAKAGNGLHKQSSTKTIALSLCSLGGFIDGAPERYQGKYCWCVWFKQMEFLSISNESSVSIDNTMHWW